MKKIIDILFVGTSMLGMAKAFVWALLCLLAVSLVEWGGNDGKYHVVTICLLIIGLFLTILSLVLTRQYKKEQEAKAQKKPYSAPLSRNPWV